MLVPGTPTSYTFKPTVAAPSAPSGGWFNITGAAVLLLRIWGGSVVAAEHTMDAFTIYLQNDPTISTGLLKTAYAGTGEITSKPTTVTTFEAAATEADPWQLVIIPATGANFAFMGIGFWAPYLGVGFSIAGPTAESTDWYIQGIPFYHGDYHGIPIDF